MKLAGSLAALRYRVIRWLVGDMPVVMNMAMFRPAGFKGALYEFPRPDAPGMFTGNVLIVDHRSRTIMLPVRDHMAKKPAVQAAANE